MRGRAFGAQMLATCHRAMPECSRLLLIEQVMSGIGSASSLGQFMDLHMLVIHGTRERTERDLTALLDSTGFAVLQAIPTATGLHIIEATKR